MSHASSLRAVLAASVGLLTVSLLPAQPVPDAPAQAATPAAPGAPAARAGRPGRAGAPGQGAAATGGQQYSSIVPVPAGQHVDWPSRLEWDLADLKVYRDANAQLGAPAPGENRVVFLGDSITENWQKTFRTVYPGKTNYLGRGRTSETTQQMLIRFRPDVIDLKPRVVVILAGTNDIAGNMGRSTDKMIQDNLISMIDLAELNKIKVVLCTIMPTTRYFWQPSVTDGAQRVVQMNKWIKEYSATRPGVVFFADIHTPMKAADSDGMNPQFSSDGTHPNNTGYALISPIVEKAINDALAAK